MKKIILILAAIASLCACCGQTCPKSPKVIAHRGWWIHEGSAQNSLASLRLAMEAGFFGSETDVQMTRDSQIVVFHDSKIKGKKVYKMTYEEVLADTTLVNGEKVSTLDEYLDLYTSIDSPTKLICEIKKQSTPEWQTYVANKVHSIVLAHGIMADRLEYISFSSVICDALKQIAPDYPVAYLEGDFSPKKAGKRGYDGIDYHYDIFYLQKRWVEKSHALGLCVNTWTVDDPKCA
ncbi:MAG: glycerophosphodiester phosphodiesterase, partial [Bacteroidales bacterium]|nr:glycerophosphodiester phosphodiesterase [Bacteroidales bacterium]